MMHSPGFSIIHKADNPQGLPHLHITEVKKVSGLGNTLARDKLPPRFALISACAAPLYMLCLDDKRSNDNLKNDKPTRILKAL